MTESERVDRGRVDEQVYSYGREELKQGALYRRDEEWGMERGGKRAMDGGTAQAWMQTGGMELGSGMERDRDGGAPLGCGGMKRE